jgi:SAM-dependent methyltransferase
LGLLDRISSRKSESEAAVFPPPADSDPLFSTKALRKFLGSLTSRELPVLIDLGPVVGSNIAYFGEQLGCKIFVVDLFADLDRFVREGRLEDFPDFIDKKFTHESESVDGILCWDFIDYLDKPTATRLASQLSRVLRPDGALLGFFSSAAQNGGDTHYNKFIVADQGVNLRARSYPALRGRQSVLLNRDIIKLFAGLRVSDSFLLKNNQREILFRKPA